MVRDSLTGALLRTPSIQNSYNKDFRERGYDWPLYGYTMVGTKRLQNIQSLLEAVLKEGIPGSFAECEVWRGGASIFARAVLNAYGATEREVHLADSFQVSTPFR